MNFNPFKKKSFSNTSIPEKWGGSFFYPFVNGQLLYNNDTIKAFTDVPEVNAILNYRASAKKNVVIRAVNKTTGEDAISPNAKKALKLLNKPNWFQGRNEFIRQASLWHDIDGNEYTYFQNAIGFKPTSARQIFTLPPQNVKICLENNGPFFFLDDRNIELTYKFRLENKDIKLPSENIIHLNDNRVTNDNDFLKGTSKLKALRDPIENIIAAYKARGKNLKNSGASGILSNSSKDQIGGTIQLDPEEKENIQKEYKKYGKQPGQFDLIITDMALNYQQITSDISKLKVFEEVKEDFFKICDSYGIDKALFSSDQGTTFNNKESAQKDFYQNTIIPEFAEWIGGFNNYFQTEKESWELRGDYSHLAVFQEDVKERSESIQTLVSALSQALEDGAITIEQYKSELLRFGI